MKLCEMTQNELCLLPEADLTLSQLREHVGQCPLCQAFAAKIRQQDRQLSTLFYPKSPNWGELVRSAVLPTVSPVVAKKERALSKIAVAFALAASLLIGVVGLLTQLNKSQNPNALANNDPANKHHLRQKESLGAGQPTPEAMGDPSIDGKALPSPLALDTVTNDPSAAQPGLGAAKREDPMAQGTFFGIPKQPSSGSLARMGIGDKDHRLLERESGSLRSLLRKDPLVGQRIKFMVELCVQQRALVVGLVKPDAKREARPDLAPSGGFREAKPMEVSPEALVQSYEELIGSDLPALLKSLPKGTQIKEMKALLDHLERTESEFSRLAADHPEKAVWLKQLVSLSRTGILQIRTAIP